MTTKYDHEVEHHNPQEGFDHSEVDSRKIMLFVVISVVTLVVTIMALQSYFEKVWSEAVYDKVLSVPGEEVGDLRSLSSWRLDHYEYADPSKTRVRIPYERAKELFLAEEAAGKTFYPAKPTEPKPEEPAVADHPEPETGSPAQAKQPPQAGKNAPEAVRK